MYWLWDFFAVLPTHGEDFELIGPKPHLENRNGTDLILTFCD